MDLFMNDVLKHTLGIDIDWLNWSLDLSGLNQICGGSFWCVSSNCLSYEGHIHTQSRLNWSLDWDQLIKFSIYSRNFLLFSQTKFVLERINLIINPANQDQLPVCACITHNSNRFEAFKLKLDPLKLYIRKKTDIPPVSFLCRLTLFQTSILDSSNRTFLIPCFLDKRYKFIFWEIMSLLESTFLPCNSRGEFFFDYRRWLSDS